LPIYPFMSWQPMPVSRVAEEARSESEFKRLRAYENLVVVVTVIVAVLILGGTFAIALSATLGDVARALVPGG
jgi:hypothetical protein